MEERKEWRSLHIINRKTHFLGFRPLQWVIIACGLFLVGFFYWWLAGLLVPLLWRLGHKVAGENRRGNPDCILGWVVRASMARYFVDYQGIFSILQDNGSRP